MTTTTAAPTVPTRTPLDSYRSAALHPDRNLDAVVAYLRHLAGQSTDHTDPLAAAIDVGALRGALSFVVDDLTRDVDANLRAAPLTALDELLRDAMKTCAGPTCGETVTPWADATCSPECAREAFLAFGEE